MQIIPSAEAIGQGDCETSRIIGARALVTREAFTHAAILCNASGSRSEGWKTRLGKFLAKWTTCSPEPLAISRMTPFVGRTSRRTPTMKSRLRSAAGAYWRGSFILCRSSQNSDPLPRSSETASSTPARRPIASPCFSRVRTFRRRTSTTDAPNRVRHRTWAGRPTIAKSKRRREKEPLSHRRRPPQGCGCWEPSWLENIELRAKKAMKRENIDQEYSHV